MLTDHFAIKSIVKQTFLQTLLTNRANKRLINALVYLSQFDLKTYHVLRRLNFVPDTLSRLKAKQNKPNRFNKIAILNDV